VLVLLMGWGGGCQEPGSVGLEQGYAALEQSRVDEATAAADRYLQDHPTGTSAAAAIYLKGRAIEQRMKRNDAEAVANLRQAKAHYLKAMELSPARPLETYIYTSAGNTCYWLGDFAGAASYWKEAYQRLGKDDLQAWVLYRIGLCQQRMGRWTDADATFAAVQKEAPGTEAADRARSHQGYRGFYVQVAAFASAKSADQVIKELRAKGYPATRQERPERKLSVVMVGPVATYADAQATKARLNSQYKDTLIIP
jgi:tetratricopeptide (TPR) repeat protein